MKVYLDPYFTNLKHGMNLSSEFYNVLFILYTHLKVRSREDIFYNPDNFFANKKGEFIQNNLTKLHKNIKEFNSRGMIIPIDLEERLAKIIWPQKRWEDRKIPIERGLKEIQSIPINIGAKARFFAKNKKNNHLTSYWKIDSTIEYVADPILSEFHISNHLLYFSLETITGSLSTRNVVLPGCPSFPLSIFDIAPGDLRKAYILLRSSSYLRRIKISKDFYLHLCKIESEKTIPHHLNQLKELGFLKSFDSKKDGNIRIIWW